MSAASKEGDKGTDSISDLAILREESAVFRKLEGHQHIIKIVGTYWKGSKFNLLTFPVADCDLDQLLND